MCWPKFTKLEGFTGSRDTRDFAHYDMHLHSQLTLKNIVYFPDMFNQLAEVVNSKMKPFRSRNAAKQLPHVDASCTLHQRLVSETLDEEGTWIIGREDMLQEIYPILQQYSSLVASTLVTGLDEWSTIFQFNKKPRVATTCAEADGYLSFDSASIEKSKLPEDLKRKLRLVIDKHLSGFLIYEFKSMNAGAKAVMLAIFYLTGSPFPWSRCPMSKHCNSQFCQMKGNRFRFNVTGSKTGVDGAVLEGKSGNNNDSNAGCFSFDISESDNSHSTDVDGNRSDDDDGSDAESNTDDDTLSFTEADYHKALKIVQQVLTLLFHLRIVLKSDVTFKPRYGPKRSTSMQHSWS